MCGSKGSKIYKSLDYAQKCSDKSLRIAESNRNREVTWGNKISESLTGKEKTKEHRTNIGESMKRLWESDPSMREKCSRKGSKHSEESKRKTSEKISKQKWYWKLDGDDVIRTRSETHPGDDWNLGRNPR